MNGIKIDNRGVAHRGEGEDGRSAVAAGVGRSGSPGPAGDGGGDVWPRVRACSECPDGATCGEVR